MSDEPRDQNRPTAPGGDKKDGGQKDHWLDKVLVVVGLVILWLIVRAIGTGLTNRILDG